jgi:hypothetical protein
MAKRTRYSEYRNSYANYKFELTDDGILFMQCHTNGDSLVWSWKAHDEMSDAFADIAGDREIKVLIHTGTGENYNANWGRLPSGEPPEHPNTIEATHSAFKTRAQNTFHLSDQELLIRQFHTVIRDTVGAYQSAKES